MGRLPDKTPLALVILSMLLCAAAARPAAADSWVGVGLHSWRTIDDLHDEGFGDIRRSGVSYLVSYQYVPGALLKFEVDGEYFDKGFGGATHAAFSPQAYVLVGGLIYGGVGIGTTVSHDFSNDVSSPFYIARVGVNLHLIPRFALDINANYHFNAFHELNDASTGTITLGAAVRFKL